VYIYMQKTKRKRLQTGWPGAIGTWQPTDV
jgi:hypothetical protein